jgi:hypothetical protein
LPSTHPSYTDKERRPGGLCNQIWGITVGFINKLTSGGSTEAVNWEPDATAGFAAGRPFGSFVFNYTPASVNDWALMD